MNNKYTKIIPFILSAVLLFTGCGASGTANISDVSSGITDTQVVTETEKTTGSNENTSNNDSIAVETTSNL